MNKLEMVKQWRRTFGLPVSDAACVPSKDQLELHCRLIWSEAQEVGEASTHIDIRDVIADLHYFILGLASEAGVTQEQLDSDFKSVHAANMAKLWTTEQVVFCFMHRTIKSRGEQVTYEDSFGKWTADAAGEDKWVVRLNGKVQKPPGWKAAVLEGGVV